MAIGPVQLIVLGFDHPNFHRDVIAELNRLRSSDTIKVIDALAVYKDVRGGVEVEHLSNLSPDDAAELGDRIEALLGLEAAQAVRPAGGFPLFTDESAWDILGEIPADSAAALLLLEHHWAVPLRDAMVGAGGFRVADGFISPQDLVEIGLVSANGAPGRARPLRGHELFGYRRVARPEPPL